VGDACAVLDIGVHAKTADNDPICSFTKQIIIRFRTLSALVETAIVVSAYATLLALRQFIFAHSPSQC